METFDVLTYAAFALFVLPGFISILVFRLLHPSERKGLKDSLFEAIAFGAINLVAMSWTLFPVSWMLPIDSVLDAIGLFLISVVVLLVAPATWPVVFVRLVRVAEQRGWVLHTVNSAWDQFFLRREDCWVIVHLKDGRRIGGYFGANSFASLHPSSGHLYLEEVWVLDEDGGFVAMVEDTYGMIFRPDDYDLVEFKKAR